MVGFGIQAGELGGAGELEALRRTNTLLGRIVRVQQEVALAGLDEDGVKRLVAERALELTRAESAVVEIVEGDELVYHAASGSAKAHLGLRLGVASSLSGTAVRTREILRARDTETDGRVDREACRVVGVGSLVVAPLVAGSRVPGVLKASSPERDAFDDSDVQVLQLLANVLAAALDAASRMDEKQRLIAELEQANRALRASEARYRLVFEGADEGLFLVGRGADGQYRYQAMNEALSRITGIPADRFIGATPGDVLPLDAAARVTTLYDRVIRTGTSQEILHTNALPRGQVSTRTRLHPLRDDRGAVIGVMGISEDVTERERVQRLKAEFVSTVSHELRTPLTSIRGALGLVAGGATGALPGRSKELVQVALRNSDRLLLLINDLLDMDKIESGRMELVMAPHAVDALVREAVLENDAYAVEHGVRLELAPAPGLCVEVDENRFHQVLNNLLSNAIKFSPEGEAVEVRIGRRGESVRISIRDRGPGIPETFQSRIFDKFSQADGSDRRSTGGTGLGLSITRALVERMGGRIWFDSDAATGTVFTVELPESASVPVRAAG